MGKELPAENANLENEDVEVEVETEAINDEVSIDEAVEPESAEESVKKAIEEIKRKETDGDTGEEKEAAPEKPISEPVSKLEPKGKKQKEKAPEQTFDDDEPLPVELSPKEKALFKKIPDKEVKAGVIRALKHYQGTMTRHAQEFEAGKKEISSILETVKPYVDQFTERNLTVAQGLGQLLVANKRLIDVDNPKGQIQEAARIIQGCRIDPDSLYAALTGKSYEGTASSGANIDIENHPYVKKLEQKISSLTEMVAPVHTERQKATDEAFQDTYKQLEGVQLETDDSGDWLRPELATDQSFLECWKPLVSRLVRTEKLSWRDAGVKAYSQLKGESFNKSSTTKFPAKNNQNKAVSAAVSVRGRSAPLTNSKIDEEEIPSDETPVQSVMRAIQGITMRG